MGRETARGAVGAPGEEAEELRPASFAQEREWFLDQLDPGTAAYNIPLVVRFAGTLDVPALGEALDLLVERHASLRTRVPTVDGRPVQAVARELRLPLPVLDAREPTEEAKQAAIRSAIEHEFRVGFDLAQGPLVRARLLRLGDADHVLLLTIHHIVVDAWSLGVLCRELETVYGALVRGEPPTLPELPFQYADFAERQREALHGERLERQLRYWSAQLADAPSALDLPLDFPRPPQQTFAGDAVEFDIPAAAARRVVELAHAEQTTPFATVAAAFAALLARLCDEETIPLGTYVANRTLQGSEEVVGFFVNTAVLVADVRGDPTFRELLGRMRRTVLGALANGDVPFERVLEEVKPERDPQRTPLFQVTVEVQEPVEPPRLPGVEATSFPAENTRAEFDLELNVKLRRALACRLKYDIALFERATVARIGRQLRAVVEALVGNPDLHVSELPLVDSAERGLVLGGTRLGPRVTETGATLDELFADQVARSPEAPAIAGASEWSYRALGERVSRVAGALQAAGVGPETVVGVLAQAGADAVAALLGVIGAGGVYLPLDADYPAGRIAFMVRDSGASVVLVEPALRDRLRAEVPALVLPEVLVSDSAPPATRAVSTPEQLAYLIYTSGSTGTPKGVGVSHANVVPLLEWSRDFFAIGSETRTLQNLSLSFDFGLYEVLLTALFGGCLDIPAERPIAPEALAEYADERGITALHATPSQAAAVAAAVRPLEHLRILHLGGEELTWELVEAVEAIVPRSCRIVNGYGPTENSVNTTLFEVPRDGRPARRGPSVPIGSPTAASRVYVLDGRLEPVPVGVRGELFTAGLGVARGYVGRPGLTAERFLPDPFAADGGRLYRTGDVARVRGDGELEFVGRVDEQLKLRGFRVEPGEVEAALRRHPGVREAAVVARPGPGGEPRLVAYLVGAHGRAPGQGELRAFLAQTLPEYMLPAAYVSLERLPLTANGKLDRQALPAPQPERPPDGRYRPPRSPLEQLLADSFGELLELERVGRDDNFFQLGGHSLLAARLAAKLRSSLQLDLPLRTLFQHPTPAELAVLVTERQGELSAAAPPPIVPVPRERHRVRLELPVEGRPE